MTAQSDGEAELEATGERLVPAASWGELVHAEHLARYQLAARLAPGLRVLDAACGEGYGTAMLAAAGADYAIGIDIDEATVAHAQRRYGLDFRSGDVSALDFRSGDVSALDLDDASIDLITSFETIEHVADPDAVLDQFKRVLAPGGWLMISTPNCSEYLVDNPFHTKEFSSGEFIELLSARFEHVLPLYQQNFLLSALLDQAGLAQQDATEPLRLEVLKLVGIPPGQELYTLALCGAKPPPGLAVDVGVLADVHEAHLLARTLREWQKRALRAEELVGEWPQRAQEAERLVTEWEKRALRAEELVVEWPKRAREAERLVGEWNARATEAERQNAELRGAIERIRHSLSWRVTKPLRGLRQAGLPRRDT